MVLTDAPALDLVLFNVDRICTIWEVEFFGRYRNVH